MTMSAQVKHVLLLTGQPGVGKTTLIRKVAQALSNSAIAGFYTEELREEGVRQGFRLVTFNGHEGVIAHVNFSHRYSVGKYGVDVAAIDHFADSMVAMDQPIDLYLIDEIGKMETLSARFDARIRALSMAEKPLVATISKQGGGLIEEMKRQPFCEVWEVNQANRDQLLGKVLGWIRGRL